VFRSLTNRESIDFLEALQEMLWIWRNRNQAGELTAPLTVNAEGAAMTARGVKRPLRAFFFHVYDGC
jgi:hypothetical protein